MERFIRLSERFLQLGVHNSFLCVYLCETESISNGAGSAWKHFLFFFFTWGKKQSGGGEPSPPGFKGYKNTVPLINYSIIHWRPADFPMFVLKNSGKFGRVLKADTERHLAKNVYTTETWTKGKKLFTPDRFRHLAVNATITFPEDPRSWKTMVS